LRLDAQLFAATCYGILGDRAANRSFVLLFRSLAEQHGGKPGAILWR